MEKKYFWTNKKKDQDGECLYLQRVVGGAIVLVFENFSTETYKLTESEIRELGYNP